MGKSETNRGDVFFWTDKGCCTKGRVEIDAKAAFFEGYHTLPAVYADAEDSPSSNDVPDLNFFTTSQPHPLPGHLDDVKRRFVFEWDCCQKKTSSLQCDESSMGKRSNATVLVEKTMRLYLVLIGSKVPFC